MRQLYFLLFLCVSLSGFAQDYGVFPKISKEKLLLDLELLYQGLDKYHTGMYWYTPKDSVDLAFEVAKQKIKQDLNVLEFNKIIAPLVGLSREDHTNIFLSEEVKDEVRKQARFLPFAVVFLGEELYLYRNGSSLDEDLDGKRILAINGRTIQEIVTDLGSLFASDGYINRVKYSDLSGFSFASYYYYFYGNMPSFKVEFEDGIVELKSESLNAINQKFRARYQKRNNNIGGEESLEFKILNDSVAYLGIHSFDNGIIKENSVNKKLKPFLEESFEIIAQKNVQVLIFDLGENSGGNEGNENLCYSYLGENYQKYKRVKAKAQKVLLDNGVDQPIKLKTFNLLEKLFGNRKMEDGSFERKENVGFGLMAYKKEPKNKFKGRLFVITSPITYSGGSELSNMIYSNNLATFVGQETGGGYYGNTSGYSEELTLPHSRITIDLPSLKFEMNVKESIPFGRGVIPHHEVIPTYEQFVKGENAPLAFILDLLKK